MHKNKVKASGMSFFDFGHVFNNTLQTVQHPWKIYRTNGAPGVTAKVGRNWNSNKTFDGIASAKGLFSILHQFFDLTIQPRKTSPVIIHQQGHLDLNCLGHGLFWQTAWYFWWENILQLQNTCRHFCSKCKRLLSLLFILYWFSIYEFVYNIPPSFQRKCFNHEA